MSNVAEAVDFRPGMVQWLGTLASFYAKDIRALPENLLTVSPGGVAKTPGSMTAEVAGLMRWTAATLREQTPPAGYDGEDNQPTTHDGCCGLLDKATADLSDAISTADPAVFQKMVTAPFGVDMPIMALCQITINHIWYHDGQICLIQAMNGDDKVHWM